MRKTSQITNATLLGARRFCVLMTCAVLAACGTAPKRGGFYQDDGPPDKVPADILATPDAVPRAEPFHPYANRPYSILGRTYRPDTSDRPFKQRGLASWYGRQFHGNRTANGERYDMFAMTAAHTTLPLPSYARVTNLRTGASVIVRINDRGPFKNDRIIDLSYAAAVKLGIAARGSGEVEVERITRADIDRGTWASAGAAAAVDTLPISPRLPLPPPPGAIESPREIAATAPGASAKRWAVQLGAFELPANADELRARASLLLAAPEADDLPAAARTARVERDGSLYRVLVGLLTDRTAALQLAQRLARLLDRETALYLQ
jgi:rare lipoprotein A